jgi:hypothetical protein
MAQKDSRVLVFEWNASERGYDVLTAYNAREFDSNYAKKSQNYV